MGAKQLAATHYTVLLGGENAVLWTECGHRECVMYCTVILTEFILIYFYKISLLQCSEFSLTTHKKV